MRGLVQRLLHDEAGALYGEERDHDDADDDAVDTECGEVVLLDVAHEEADRDDRHDERTDDAHRQHHDLGLGHDQPFHHELRRLHHAPTEHDGDSQEERVFRGDLARRADEDAAEHGSCPG